MTASRDRVALRNAVGLLALCVLAACAGQHSRKTPAATGQAASAPAAAPLDASYDWHGLVLMPFGTLLKSSPLALHEVLLFHDDSHATSSELGKDCYTVDGKPPRLAGHATDEFLLCFSHDRLDRIEASVPMKAGEGPGVLARACSLWLKHSAPPAGGTSCEGRDGDVAFSAHLGQVSGDASADAAAGTGTGPAAGAGSVAGSAAATVVDFQTEPSILSLVLSQTADRGISTAPEH
jgi:hypothetical protein